MKPWAFREMKDQESKKRGKKGKAQKTPETACGIYRLTAHDSHTAACRADSADMLYVFRHRALFGKNADIVPDARLRYRCVYHQ